jgi:predicted GH43/DUF377 family glycosyl hydrolase
MLNFKRSLNNPLLSPNSQNNWESYAAFNGCPIKVNDTYHLLYRAISQHQQHEGKELQLSTIGHATSTDGETFTDRKQLISPEYDWEKYGCEDPRVTYIDGQFFIFYTGLSDFPPGPPSIKIGVAITRDFKTITEKHLVTPFNAKAMALFPQKINGQFVAILTVNTDLPPAKIAIARFDKIEDMWSSEYWHEWYKKLDEHIVPLQRLNSDQIEVGAPPVETPDGWLFIYAHIQHYYTQEHRIFGIEAALLDKNNPQKIIGRIETPLLIPQEQYELEGTVSNIVFPSGAITENSTFHLYYGAADTTCCRASCLLTDLLSKMRISAPEVLKLKRFEENPIISPKPEHNWESQGVFNPTAVYENNKVHLLYRVFSQDNTSMFGYANSVDGYHIDERSIGPAYYPRMEFEDKKKMNAFSGCEDPRMTKIDNRYYVCDTAFDTIGPPRVALTSIAIDDFLAHKWNWTNPVLISPPGVDDKDACIFPEKVNGKYVIFHRIEHNIVMDYVDNLNFDGKTWLKSLDYISVRQHSWDDEKIGIAGPPIKTNEGWLLLYHGISSIDHHYRVGAMLLQIDKPTNVLARTTYPLLEPETSYEKYGLVNNVVFPCGMVVLHDQLFVYYGGADKVIGVATIHFPTLLSYLVDLKEEKFLV